MASPKMRPKTQKTMPKSSSLCPSIPRNETCERSGTFRAASPPASCAAVAAPVRRARKAAAELHLANLHPKDQALASQVRIKSSIRKNRNQGKGRPGHSFPAHHFIGALRLAPGGTPCRISKGSHLRRDTISLLCHP